MSIVSHFALKDKGPCKCGVEDCKEFGVYKSNGKCVKSCSKCVACRNGKSSKDGKAKHRKLARTLVKAGKGKANGSNEESWRLVWRTEVKSDRQAQSVETFYERTRDQANNDKSFGDTRTFVAIAVCKHNSYAVIPIPDMDGAADDWVNG